MKYLFIKKALLLSSAVLLVGIMSLYAMQREEEDVTVTQDEPTMQDNGDTSMDTSEPEETDSFELDVAEEPENDDANMNNAPQDEEEPMATENIEADSASDSPEGTEFGESN